MVVEFQPLLSYFLDGSALRPYRACGVHTSRVAPRFYCLVDFGLERMAAGAAAPGQL